MVPARRSPIRVLWLALVLVAATFATFGRSLGFGFVLVDDDKNVYDSALVHPEAGELTERLGRIWAEPYYKLYIPVTYSTWALVAQSALVPEERVEEHPLARNRLAPRPFHLANLCLHAVCVLLVFGILRTALGVDFAAALGALFCALHPLQVEPVAWISGLKDLTGGLFALACVWAYLRYARAVESGAERSGMARAFWLASLVALALGLLAKPSAVVAPVVAGLLDVLVLRRRLAHSARALAPLLAVAAAGAVAIAAVQPPDPELAPVSLGQRPLVVLDALGFYAAKLAWPLELAPFYGRTPEVVLDGAWWWGALAVAVLAAGALASGRRSGVPLAALGVFAAALGPTLGLVPFTFQAFSTVADRYAYLALVGPALLLAWLARGRRAVLFGGALGCLVLGGLSWQQAGTWRDSETLFRHNLEVFDGSAFVHGNLGEHHAREGDVEAAVHHFREAVRLKPSSAQQRNNLGSYLGQKGRLDEALVELEQAVRLDPDYARARMGLAGTLIGLGRLDEAERQLEEVHRIEPEFVPAYLNRAAIRWQQGDTRGARRAYEEALAAQPAATDASLALAGLHLQEGRALDALRVLRAADEAAPGSARVQLELGRALLSSNRALDALPCLEEAVRLDPGLAEEAAPMLAAARAAAGGGQ